MKPLADLRVIVLGYLVRGPIGGMAWSDLHYLLGLRALGADVLFLEDSHDFPMNYDPSRQVTGRDPSFGLAFASRVLDRVGLRARWAYFDAHRGSWHGPRAQDAVHLCTTADIALNLGGVNPIRSWTRDIPVRVFVDKDPVFTQIRHLDEPEARALAARHTHFLTFGESFGRDGCSIPDDSFPWRATRHPIALSEWPVCPGVPGGDFTSVMQWKSYATRRHAGTSHGMKAESFEAYEDLPAMVGSVFRLAIGGGAPIDRLAERGWRISDPSQVAADPWSYRRFIQDSKAEFAVAKHGYVVARSGWFSERSASYLASGRPVLVQDTGFGDWMTTGSGVLAFASPEEAAAGVESIEASYEAHCRAARDIAQEYFDARRVLAEMIRSVLEPGSTEATLIGHGES